MSEPNVQKKSRSILWLPVIVLLLVAGWTVYWFAAAHWLEGRVDAKLAQWKANGYAISYANRHMSGWPYRFALAFDDVKLVADAEHDGWQLQQPKMLVHAMAWKLNHMIVEADGTSILHPADGSVLQLSQTRARASIILHGGDLSRLSMELVAPQLRGADKIDVAQADLIEAHAREGSKPDSRRVFIRAGNLHGAEIPFAKPVDIKGDGEVFAWNELVNQRSLEKFRMAAGQARIASFAMSVGDAAIDVSGLVYIGQNGHPAGKLKTQFTNPGEFLVALKPGILGADGEEAVQTLQPIIGGLKQAGLSFTFKKQGMYAGPFRLMKTKALLPPQNQTGNL